jgi:sugar (pentulose or hexulose) kinase
MSLIGVDIGSQSTKAYAVNTEGALLASSSFSYDISYPNQGWAEEDANLWWFGTKQILKDIFKKVNPNDVSGIAFSGQAPTILPIDRQGNPLMPAIIWIDHRSIEECKIIEDTIGQEKVFATSGNRIDPYFGGAKILWLKRNKPTIYKKTWKILQSHSYPIFKLTGQTVTDYSTAGLCSPIFDYTKKKWSHEMIDDLQVNPELLPQIAQSNKIAGEITSEACEEVGLRKGTPVIVGGADAMVSMLSVGVIEEGDVAIMLGTACNFLLPMKSPKFDERLLGTMHVVKDIYTVVGSSFAGGVLKWLKDQIMDVEDAFFKDSGTSLYEVMDKKASILPAGSEDLIMFPYFLGGLAPIWNPHAKGIYFGLNPKHGKAHLYRAVLEATGYSFLYAASIMKEKGVHPKMIYGVNGGAKSTLWRQILSDILDIPFAYVKNNMGTPMGDVVLAGVGTGVFRDERIAENWVKIDETNYPMEENNRKYQKYYNIYTELYERTKELFPLLYSTNR